MYGWKAWFVAAAHQQGHQHQRNPIVRRARDVRTGPDLYNTGFKKGLPLKITKPNFVQPYLLSSWTPKVGVPRAGTAHLGLI